MRNKTSLVYLIGLIVFVTISIQVYWNYIQYTNNTTRVVNDIQQALEDAVVSYNNIKSSGNSAHQSGNQLETTAPQTDSIEAIVANILKELGVDNPQKTDRLGKENISYTIMSNDIDLPALDSLFQIELSKKKYAITYNLSMLENDVVIDSYGPTLDTNSALDAVTPIFPITESLIIQAHYVNPVWSSLLKGVTGIMLSLVLCSVIIFALYYLHQIIKNQKQLSEIKNDFISNVTHEFKTPIATVSSAIEGIKNFNNEQLSDKSKRYLDISEQQLKKLNQLVEKVMETSLLESNQLQLDKELKDIIKLLKDCVESFRLSTHKRLEFKTNSKSFKLHVDAFHFENSIINLLDNANKYGGDAIKVSVEEKNNELRISVSDNGAGIPKEDTTFIFDKFYRIRDQKMKTAKGFGIGLYYTKRIIESHGGTIELEDPTTFTIKLWKR